MIAAARPNHYLRVEVENADRVFKDLTNLGGVDWVESAEWGDSLDAPTGTATVSVRRDTSSPASLSLAPTMGGSSLNRNGAGAYAPLLDTGRNIRITTAVTDPGAAPVAGDWKVVFVGRIDKVNWHATPITLECRDLGGWLVDAQIQKERAYATTGALAVETVMAAVLADTPVFGSPSLYTPVSPAWAINNTKRSVQPRKSVLEALQQDYALSIGWVCRYVWDGADNFRLTFYDPNRTKTVADDTFGPTEYRDITGLEIEDADLRNLIDGIYFDSDLKKHTRTKQNTVSQGKYGVKFMEIQLAVGDLIDSDTEMDRLLDAAVSDLGAPFATHEMETLYYWPVQLGDLHQYSPNLDHYDSAQTLGVVGFTHRFANGEGLTTIQCRGNVVGAYHAWLRRTSDEAPPDDNTILRVSWNDSADGTTRNGEVTCGSSVDSLHVHHRLWPRGAAGDQFDFSAAQNITDSPEVLLVTPDPDDGKFRFSLSLPVRGFDVAGRMIPYTASPQLKAGDSRPFLINAAPPAINAHLHAARTGAIGSLSTDITFGTSDGPVRARIILDTLTTSTVLVDTPLVAPATLDAGTYPALGNIALPLGKDTIALRVVITDVAGQDYGFGPALLNRDPLPDGNITVNNYRANPGLVCAFDGPDTDSIRVTTKSGKVKTFNAAALATIGSPVTFNAIDPTDDATFDPPLVVDEARDGYKVEYQGGGTWVQIGPSITLRGQPSNPPTADIRSVPNSDRSAMDVTVRPDTQVSEKLFVYFRDGSTDTALQWIACVSAGDPTALQVVAGTLLGPANFFRRVDGVGSPTAKLSAIALGRDQVSKYGVMIKGVDSGIQSPWLDVVLSLAEQPWLESTQANFDPATRTLSATLVGGAHCASAGVLFADNDAFSAPSTASGNVADGATLKVSIVLSAAQLGRPWYVKATPFNAVSLGGLMGAAQKDSVPVPAIIGEPQITVVEGTPATGQARITIAIDDAGSYLDSAWTNGTITGALHFDIRKLGVRTIEAATTHALVGTVHTWTKDLTMDELHAIDVGVFVHFIDGSTAGIWSSSIDANKIADLSDSNVVDHGANADVTLNWDTDALIGANCARYSLDAGATWATVTVTSVLLSQYSVARTSTTQQMLVQAKNALDGNWGNQTTLKIPAYLADGPSFDVHLVEHATTTDVYWSCSSGVATLSINGGAAGTPPASPIAVTRPAAGGTKLNYAFTFTIAGQSITDAVDVLPIDADTATPNLDVAPGTPTATTQPYTVTFSNPKSGGAAPTASVTCTGCTMTIGATTYPDGTTQAVASGDVVTGNRPIGAVATRADLRFVASIAGAGSETIVVPVTPQTVVATPTGTVSVDSNGVYSWTALGASNATQARWQASTSSFPVEATVAVSGTLLTGSRTFSVASAGTLTFGQTALITVCFFDAVGNLLSTVYLRGSYQTYSGSKTTTFAPSSWEDVSDTSFRNVPPAHLGTGEFLVFTSPGHTQHFQFQPVIPDGVTITQVAVYLGWTGANSGAVTSATVAAYRRTATINSATSLGSTTFGVGSQQTKTISLSESTTGNSYYVDVAINSYTMSGGLADMYLGSVAVTYTMGDPKKTV